MRKEDFPQATVNPYDIKDKLMAAKLTEKINDYINLGSLIGPFKQSEIPFDKYHLSPLCGLWKKKPSKVSLIHNLSAPIHDSINSIIPKEHRITTYPSFQRLVEIAFNAGKNGFLWTIDLKDSYFTLPIQKKYIPLFGAKWFGRYIFYCCLPFGLATAPRIFNLFADSLQFIAEAHNPKLYEINSFKSLDHYLDDFFSGHPTLEIAQKQFNRFAGLLTNLNIPTSPKKMVSPTQKIIILGYKLDTTTQSVSIPLDKINKYLKDVKYLLHYKNKYKCTIKLLESLSGKLRHCATAFYGGAAFVRGLEAKLNYMKYNKKASPHKHFAIDRRIAYDLTFWKNNLPKLTYSTPFWFILNKRTPKFTIYTDASESSTCKSFGAVVSNGYWLTGSFFDTKFIYFIKTSRKLINIMELLAVIVTIELNVELFQSQQILIRCDNETANSWIATKRASFSNITEKFVNLCLKYLFTLLIKYKIYIKVKHISTADNTYADNLSREKPFPFKDIQLDLLNWEPTKQLYPKNIINNIMDRFCEEYNITLSQIKL